MIEFETVLCCGYHFDIYSESSIFESKQQVPEERDGVNVVTNQNAIDSWNERDVDACSIIFYNIEPTYQTSIEGSATAHEMWNRLKLQYAQVAVANSAHLLGKFHQYRMDPGK
jgi:hypothetical protein